MSTFRLIDCEMVADSAVQGAGSMGELHREHARPQNLKDPATKRGRESV